jgi:hypothetical protein
VIISYPSEEIANAFRADNRDVLDQIGQFNRDHLTRFAYISVEPVD